MPLVVCSRSKDATDEAAARSLKAPVSCRFSALTYSVGAPSAAVTGRIGVRRIHLGSAARPRSKTSRLISCVIYQRLPLLVFWTHVPTTSALVILRSVATRLGP